MYRIILIICLIIMLPKLCFCQVMNEDQVQMKSAEKNNYYKIKSPSAAFLWGFFIPGAGQYYNAIGVKGIKQECKGLFFTTSVYALGLNSLASFGAAIYRNSRDRAYWRNKGAELLLYTGLMQIWALTDAIMTANNINKGKIPLKQKGSNLSLLLENNTILLCYQHGF